MIEIIIFLILYFAQMGMCVPFHALNNSRISKDWVDFIKLTFLPYVLYYYYKDPNKLR